MPKAIAQTPVHSLRIRSSVDIAIRYLVSVLVCECVRSEVAQIVDSLRCVSEGAEHSGVNFPGFAVLTKALLNRTGLPALSTVELLVQFLSCTDVVGVHLLLTLIGCSTRILPLVVLFPCPPSGGAI